MPKNAFKAGEALTAEKMNTLLQDDRLVYGSEESRNDYVSIMTKKAVEDALSEKYTVDAGAIGTAGLANGAVATDKILNAAINESKIADGAVTTNKIVDGAITENKISCLGIDNNFIDSGEFSGTKNISLPSNVSGKFKNKFMLFLYYGVDNKDEKSPHGVHLLRTYFFYYNAESAKWIAADPEWHSWSAYGSNDNSHGSAKVSVDASGRQIVIEKIGRAHV